MSESLSLKSPTSSISSLIALLAGKIASFADSLYKGYLYCFISGENIFSAEHFSLMMSRGINSSAFETGNKFLAELPIFFKSFYLPTARRSFPLLRPPSVRFLEEDYLLCTTAYPVGNASEFLRVETLST